MGPLSIKGSYVYAAYDADHCLLYVGQTGESIKTRFRGDGSGAHKNKNSCWYKDVKYVEYLKLDADSKECRLWLEHTLIFAGKPKHNKRKGPGTG